MGDGIMKANRGTIRQNWTIFPVFAMVWYGIYQVGKAGSDSKFSVSLRETAPEGNWMYGPPDPKAQHHRHEHAILHAPEKEILSSFSSVIYRFSYCKIVFTL